MKRPRDPAEFLDAIREWTENGIPFNRVLGVRVLHIEKGRVRIAVPFREELIGDIGRPALHGGVISALIDLAGGIAIWTKIEPADRLSTIDLRVDYLLPGPPKTIIAEAVVIRVGGRVGVADVRVVGEGDVEPCALGKGVYSIKRGPKPLERP
ncbi:MAG: hotdog fold thioesterase [Myxococcota bacterium]